MATQLTTAASGSLDLTATTSPPSATSSTRTTVEDYPDGQFGDDAQFYARTGDVSGGEEIPPCTPGDYWIHIDALGRVSFYTDRCNALAGCDKGRVTLESVAGNITIAPYGSIEYVNAIWECIYALGEYVFSDGQDTVTLVSICEDPPLYQKPEAGANEYDNADLQPRGLTQGKAAPFWEILCEIREWSLELDAPAVDTTSVAEKWGNAVKSLVTGGGSAEFFIDRLCREPGQSDSLTLMKLLLMTEKGCKADAQFWMIDRPGCSVDCDLIQRRPLLRNRNPRHRQRHQCPPHRDGGWNGKLRNYRRD